MTQMVCKPDTLSADISDSDREISNPDSKVEYMCAFVDVQSYKHTGCTLVELPSYNFSGR